MFWQASLLTTLYHGKQKLFGTIKLQHHSDWCIAHLKSLCKNDWEGQGILQCHRLQIMHSEFERSSLKCKVEIRIFLNFTECNTETFWGGWSRFQRLCFTGSSQQGSFHMFWWSYLALGPHFTENRGWHTELLVIKLLASQFRSPLFQIPRERHTKSILQSHSLFMPKSWDWVYTTQGCKKEMLTNISLSTMLQKNQTTIVTQCLQSHPNNDDEIQKIGRHSSERKIYRATKENCLTDIHRHGNVTTLQLIPLSFQRTSGNISFNSHVQLTATLHLQGFVSYKHNNPITTQVTIDRSECLWWLSLGSSSAVEPRSCRIGCCKILTDSEKFKDLHYDSVCISTNVKNLSSSEK